MSESEKLTDADRKQQAYYLVESRILPLTPVTSEQVKQAGGLEFIEKNNRGLLMVDEKILALLGPGRHAYLC